MPLFNQFTAPEESHRNGLAHSNTHKGRAQTTTQNRDGENGLSPSRSGKKQQQNPEKHLLEQLKSPDINRTSSSSSSSLDIVEAALASSTWEHNKTDVANRTDDTTSQNGLHSTRHQNGADGHRSSPEHHHQRESAKKGATDKSLTEINMPDISSHLAGLPTSPFTSPSHGKKLITNGVSEPSPTAGNPRDSLSSPSRRHFRSSRELELSIPLYYAGKNIFVTGATGFIGKVFVEKLLRSCPDVGGIYCLIRSKNEQTIEERLAELVDSKLFDGLRRDQPNFLSKIHPVMGDVLLPDLGISPEDSHTLEEHVHLVFHSAATVRFNEPLRKAVEMNVIAVRKMLNLSRKIKHLEAFVHVSTAYANCDKSYIEERVYPPPVEPQKIIDVLGWMDDEMVDLFTPKLIGEKPNTYTYTKQLAEHLLVTEGADLPLAIVRPSIVGAAWREPFPGWIDNLNGPSGMYIAAGKGILRWMKADTNAVADMVPVDIPVNIMVAVGWYTAVAKPNSVHIYHATSGSTNPFRWGEIGAAVNKSFKEIPLEKCFRRPKVTLGNNTFVTDYSKFVSHLCPAYICDMALALVGRKPRMVKMYNKLHHSIDVLQFFTCNEWQWESTNLEILRHQLTPDDLRMFYFDIRPLHWPTYIENYCLGAKKYVLNEDLSGLPAARAHIRKLRIIRTIFNSAVCVILWRVLIAKSQFARNLWFFIVSLVFKFVRFFRITSTMHK